MPKPFGLLRKVMLGIARLAVQSEFQIEPQCRHDHRTTVPVVARIVDVPSLQRLSAARGTIDSLMAELMEDHIRNHIPDNSKSSEEAADDVIQIVRTWLK